MTTDADRVKPLEWVEREDLDYIHGLSYYAVTPFKKLYHITLVDGSYRLEGHGKFSSLEAAKAAAQADYEALATALAPAPQAADAEPVIQKLDEKALATASAALFGEYDPSKNYHCWIDPHRPIAEKRLADAIAAYLAAAPQEAPADDETYELGKSDGYSQAVQEIDRLTGGDGEYRYCTDKDPERHTPDPAAMVQRIVGRFAATAPASPVPEGWVLVPKEMTLDMCIAAHKQAELRPSEVTAIWHAVVAAAQEGNGNV